MTNLCTDEEKKQFKSFLDTLQKAGYTKEGAEFELFHQITKLKIGLISSNLNKRDISYEELEDIIIKCQKTTEYDFGKQFDVMARVFIERLWSSIALYKNEK